MIKAVTIDFWNTLVNTGNGDVRKQIRHQALKKAFASLHKEWDEVAVQQAFTYVYASFESRWFGEQKTTSASESLSIVWEKLHMNVSKETHASVVRAFEESILHGTPNLLPSVEDTLNRLSRQYTLAVISDTAFSPGSMLRKVLQKHGIEKYFTYCVFSDEVGVSKPHYRTFETALQKCDVIPDEAVHIGDIERTDIRGAKNVGMRAILYKGDEASHSYNDATTKTVADAVAHTWEEIPGILSAWDSI